MRKFGINRILDQLNKMIDSATDGTFEETDYNESKLSKLEVKWKQFLTSSKLSRQKIETEQENLKSLVSDISHQSKTPLTNILLYTELLQEKDLDTDTREMVNQISFQSIKLEFLIQSLVKMSRLEIGTLILYPKLQKLMPMLDQIMEQAKMNADKKGIELLFTSADQMDSKAVYDRKWTEEAIYNILDNAIKYSKIDSQVSINIKEYELFSCINIEDSGMGIDEDEIPSIFKRFYRGKRVQDMEGVGIGLYLSREIIHIENGYIKVASTPGMGSTFSVFLPKF